MSVYSAACRRVADDMKYIQQQWRGGVGRMLKEEIFVLSNSVSEQADAGNHEGIQHEMKPATMHATLPRRKAYEIALLRGRDVTTSETILIRESISIVEAA